MNNSRFRLPPLFTPADLLLLLALGGVSLGYYGLRLWSGNSHGTAPLQVVVQSGDSLVARLDLSRDTTVSVSGALGRVKVVVSHGRAAFADAPCPLKICEKSGPISRRGEMIVCAPNKVLARIEGGSLEKEDGLDALSR